MYPWMIAHPWMTFFIALGAIDAVRAVLSPSCPKCSCVGATPIQTSGGLYIPMIGRLPEVPVPYGNGVYHGLVRA
jgi:hypothetical protein